jgi:protein TonB
MNSTPRTIEPAVLWQSDAEIAELYPVSSARTARRKVRSWQSRASILGVVLALQAAFAFAIIKAGNFKMPVVQQAIEVFSIPSETTVAQTPPPPMPIIHVPSDTVVTPVQFDVASDTAITVNPPQPHDAAPPPVGANTAAVITNYQLALLHHLAMHKRYPASARAAHREGVVNVRFSMARDGRVLDAALASSSHVPALDEEGVQLLYRASPLPPPPPEVRGDPIAMVVPVEFSLR